MVDAPGKIDLNSGGFRKLQFNCFNFFYKKYKYLHIQIVAIKNCCYW